MIRNFFFSLCHRQENKIYTHLTIAEKRTLFQLACALPPSAIVVEIGSYLGASSVFLAKGLGHSGGKLYCVDTWKNQGMSEGERDTYEVFLSNTVGYKDRVVPLRGFSCDVAKGFDRKIDLMFFDGDHSEDGVKSDVSSWFPKLKPGAVVVFHDYGWAEGVQKTVCEDVLPLTCLHRSLPNMWWGVLA